MLREFQEEIARLKSQLSTRQEKSAKRRKSAKRHSNIISGSDSNKLMESSDMSTSSEPMNTSTEMSTSNHMINTNKAADDMEARLAIERELLEAEYPLGELQKRTNVRKEPVSAKRRAFNKSRKTPVLQFLKRVKGRNIY